MRAFIAGVAGAIVLAVIGYVALNAMQESSTQRFAVNGSTRVDTSINKWSLAGERDRESR